MDAAAYRERAKAKMEYGNDPIPDLLMAISLSLSEIADQFRAVHPQP